MKGEHIALVFGLVAFLVACLVLIFIALYPKGIAGQQGRGTITVSATGTAYAYPQQSVINLMVNGSGPSSSGAVANISTTLDLVNSTLARYDNNNASAIETTYYSVYRPVNSTGYVAIEDVKVTLPQIGNTTRALADLSGLKNVYVQDAYAQLSAEQANALIGSALKNALSNATYEAKALAGNFSVSLENVSAYAYYRIFPAGTYEGAAGEAQGSGTYGSQQLFFYGKQGITESVEATYLYR